jgi:hypothetical protein
VARAERYRISPRGQLAHRDHVGERVVEDLIEGLFAVDLDRFNGTLSDLHALAGG